MSRSSKAKEKAQGMPGTWRWPGLRAIFSNAWNTDKDAEAFPPKVWGYGWSLNFGYPLIRSKPLWKRVLVFVIGLAALLLIIYLLVVLGVLIYYMLTPQQAEQIVVVLE